MSKPDKVREALIARGVANFVIEDGLQGLVKRWERVASDLESGYWGLFYEWLDAMDGRDILALALSVAAENELRMFADRVRIADELVRSRSTVSHKCIWRSENAAKHGWTPENQWWYFLVPKLADRDFAADFEALD